MFENCLNFSHCLETQIRGTGVYDLILGQMSVVTDEGWSG